MDQNTVCNLGTYNRRVWCRAEVFSLYCRQGFEDMHIAVEPDASYQLINVDEDHFCDTFLVFERSLLVSLYSIDAIQKILATQQAIIIFISHQWLAWIEPDASWSRNDVSCRAR